MKVSSISLIFVIAISTVSQAAPTRLATEVVTSAKPAHARALAPKPAKRLAKKARSPEIYSAVEDEVEVKPAAAVAAAAVTPETPQASRHETLGLSRKASESKSSSTLDEAAAIAPVPVALAAPTHSFDSVPGDQSQAVQKRLFLVQEIIRKHGRAYDYRLLTSRDLESILQGLENAQD